MRFGRILKYVLIGIPLLAVLVIGIAIAVLMSIDFNEYKPLIAEKVKEATGRDLVIAGELKLDISLTPAVYVAGVTLSNADWGERPEMIKIDRFEAQIALIPVVFGAIDIKRVVLIGADILLEVDKQGRANFVFAPTETQAPEAPSAAAPADGKERAVAVGVREVVIENSRIAYRDARSGAKYDVGMDRLTVSGDGPDAPISLLYEGSYNKAAIELAGSLGSPNDLMAGKPMPIDVSLRAGGAEVTVNGRVAEPMTAKGLDLAISVNGEQLGALSALAGTPVPPLGAYSLSARVTGDPASAVSLGDLKAALAGNDLAGDVTVKLSGRRPVIDANLSSNRMDLATLGGAADTPPADGGAGMGPAASERIFPDDPLPLEGLRAVDATLKYNAKAIIASGARLDNAVIGLSLKGGNLTIEPLAAGLADGTIEGSIGFDGRKTPAGLVVKTTMRKVDLDRLLSELKITEDVEGRANVEIDIAGSGSSVRRIMGSLNGRAGLLMGKGRMKDTFLQSLLGGSGQLMNRVLDRGQAGYTVVECAVASFEIRKGVATANALYLDIDPRGVIGSGSVDLGNETLDLLVDPRKKRSMDKPVLPMLITGTFMAPKYEVDKTVATQKLTKALGLKLPPALSGGQDSAAVPLIEGPCAPPQPAAAQPPAQQESAPAAAPTDPQAPLKDVEQQLKKGLKGLFGQ